VIAKTHMLSSLSLGMAIPIVATTLYHFPLPNSILLALFLGGVFVGSTFPDIDEPNSYIGRKLSLFSRFLSLFINHRGITHTILVLFIYYGLFFALLTTLHFDAKMREYIIYSFAGFIVGNIGHILGDMTTISGVSLFYPVIRKNIGLLPKPLRYCTGGKVENSFIRPLFTLIFLAESFYLFKMYNGHFIMHLL